MTLPMPMLEATVSDRTAPTKDRVIATLRDAKKYGIARGRPTFQRISDLEAPSVLSTSSSSGSVVASPVAMFTTIGNTQITIAVSTAGVVPEPNQSTKIGTTATFGIEEKPTSKGYATAYATFDVPTITPNVT